MKGLSCFYEPQAPNLSNKPYSGRSCCGGARIQGAATRLSDAQVPLQARGRSLSGAAGVHARLVICHLPFAILTDMVPTPWRHRLCLYHRLWLGARDRIDCTSTPKSTLLTFGTRALSNTYAHCKVFV